MNEQIVPTITSLITSIDFNREGLDLQGFIDAVKRGYVRKPLTDWIASRGWESTILKFTSNFDTAFIGEHWSVLTDTDNGNSFDLSKVGFVTCLKDGEPFITGKEQLIRLKADNYRSLGGKAFMVCWENRHLLSESWKIGESGKNRFITFIFFDGLVLLNPNGSRCSLYLYWFGGRWMWDCCLLDNARDTSYPSAVLVD